MKIFLLSFILLFAFSISAIADPSIWTVDSRAEIVKGESHGVSIDQNGTITLAPKLSEIFKTEQPYIWSSAVDPSGNIFLGTGSDGKIFKVDAAGKGSLFADLSELNVSALAVGKAGELFAGTSPDGKVYKIDTSGKADIYFDPKEKYIWSLAVMEDGSLAVGTGDAGKIYRVRSAGAARDGSLLFDSGETHIITLATDKAGNLYAGTDASGLVIRISPDGKPFAMLDSPLREVHDLSIGDDGSVYALLLGDSASSTSVPVPAVAGAAVTANSTTVSADRSLMPQAVTIQKSRYDLSGAKSAVYRILPDGGTDIIWSSSSIAGFSLLADRNRGVLIGTSDRGRIYSVTNDGRETLALQTDASQISTIRAVGQKLLATSSNQGSLFQLGPDTNTEGTYESSVLDTRSTATWGRIWWNSAGSLSIQTRSGNTEKPDATWNAWSAEYTDPKSSQVASPKARYLQWRAVLRSGGSSPSLSEVSVSFLARNIAPEILSIQVLPTNVGLASSPAIQIDPNIALSGLDPMTFGLPSATVPPRKIFQRNATSLQWSAEDRNGDKLVYDLYFKEVGESSFKLLKADLSDNFYTVDGQSLADGRYIFKVVAKDLPSNPPAYALSGERVSDPVDIDNTPPVVTAARAPQASGDKVRMTFNASDAASYITRAEYSVNGADWLPIYADDGISDGPKESYTIDTMLRSPGEYSVTIRVYDVNGNAGNARVVVKKK